MRAKKNPYSVYNWNIFSKPDALRKIDNKYYAYLTNTNRAGVKEEYIIDRYITESADFMDYWNQTVMNPYHITDNRFILLTTLPGIGKSTLFYEMSMQAENEYMVMVVPTRCICNQTAQNPKYKKNIRVINSLIHNSVTKSCHKYVVTAELCSSIVKNIKKIDSSAIIHLVIDEAHEILFDIANFRNGATVDVLKTIYELGQNPYSKFFFVTATPEAIMNIAFDRIISLKPKKGIDSGFFHVHSLSVENGSVSWATAYARVIGDMIQNSEGRPVFCLYNNIRKTEAIAGILRAQGYHVVCADSRNSNRDIINFVEKYQILPAATGTGNDARKIDVILTTSVILSGVSIYPNQSLGDKQYIPCIISDSVDKFNLAEACQFFTRTRYDVPEIHLIKKECKNESVHNRKAASVDELRTVIASIINPVIKGSMHGQGYQYNNMLAGAESFLEDREKVTNDLTFFDTNINCLTADLFAVQKCAWDNFNSRLYIDNNQNALLTGVQEHLCITAMNYERRVFDEACDRLTGEDKAILKEERKKNKEERRAKAEAFLAMDKCMEKLYSATRNDIVNEFKLTYRNELTNINMIAGFAGQEAAIAYIKEILDGSQKTRSAMRHEVISNALAAPVKLNGQQVNALFVVKTYENMEYVPQEIKWQVDMLKSTPEYKQASAGIDAGMTCQDAATQAVESKTLHESKMRTYAQSYLKALYSGVNIAKTSRLGNEIQILVDKFIYIKDECIKLIFGDTFHLTYEQLCGFADCLQDNVSWMHKSSYSAKTVLRMLKSLFKVQDCDDNTVLVSIC